MGTNIKGVRIQGTGETYLQSFENSVLFSIYLFLNGTNSQKIITSSGWKEGMVGDRSPDDSVPKLG